MDQDKIGKFIRQIRKENNLTQKELANRLGVTHQAVSKWENGKNIPDIGVMKDICEKFNTNIDELLNGDKKEQKNKKRKYLLIVPILLIIILAILIILLINGKNNDFEFKTMSSRCSEFNITGSAAYNKDKTSIYISNIEVCKNEDKEEYSKINCTLYEKDEDLKKAISSCPEKNNTTLEEYLKDVNINVDNYATACKRLTSNTLSLEIVAIKKDGKTVTYTIPIKLNDNCK